MNPLFTNAPIVWREHYDFDYEKIMPVIEETFSLCGERQVRKVFLENGEAGFLFNTNKKKALYNSLTMFMNTDEAEILKKKLKAKKNSIKFTMFRHQIQLKKILN